MGGKLVRAMIQSSSFSAIRQSTGEASGTRRDSSQLQLAICVEDINNSTVRI
jgi:hypothetical protein